MRILHTADLHLGLSLNNFSMHEDQEYVLMGQLLDVLRQGSLDLFIIAGDIYDRAYAPTESVSLFDAFIEEVVLKLNIPTVLIPGNHDSPQRLSALAPLVRGAGLHIVRSCVGSPIRFDDEHGPVYILASGYAKERELYVELGESSVVDHDTGFCEIAKRFRASVPNGGRTIVTAHCFLQAAERCDSERDLTTMGGQGLVHPRHFQGFNYVALGHLHRPQSFESGRIRYSGSPLAYSASEAGQKKSLAIIDMDARGDIKTELVKFSPKREVRCVEGSFEDILAQAKSESSERRDDYISVTLTDSRPVYEPMAALREFWPRTVSLSYASRSTWSGADPIAVQARARKGRSPVELFDGFCLAISGEGLSEEERPVIEGAIEKAREAAEAMPDEVAG